MCVHCFDQRAMYCFDVYALLWSVSFRVFALLRLCMALMCMHRFDQRSTRCLNPKLDVCALLWSASYVLLWCVCIAWISELCIALMCSWCVCIALISQLGFLCLGGVVLTLQFLEANGVNWGILFDVCALLWSASYVFLWCVCIALMS